MMDLQQETARHSEHTAPVEAWDTIAAQYDKHVAPGESELATAGLRLAGLQAGETFLDVAAGPGGLSLPAARLGAKVLATDWSRR
jgi:2-polyprenyl-3-methyl-5-hydroxy-6-metoxy-1,4-benzoquinol methylase